MHKAIAAMQITAVFFMNLLFLFNVWVIVCIHARFRVLRVVNLSGAVKSDGCHAEYQ